jgi:hypothetical protein
MDIIPFEHKMAAHCETGTLHGLMHFNKLELTEPMIFGIASGIFFGYFKLPMMIFPAFIVRIRPGEVRKNIEKRLGVKFNTYKYRDQHKAQEELDQLLAKGIPVAVQVDFFYMDYLPAWNRVHNNVHFITIIGKEDDNYVVSDCYFPRITRIDAESLRKGRFAGGNSAPKGFMYYPVSIPKSFDLPKQIVKGIEKACYNMLKIPLPIVGVKGIRRFSKKVIEWPGLARDIDHLSHEVMKINVLLEDQGTGGAGFRFMYATFLRQASDIMNHEGLKEMSEKMMKIGDDWREISVFAARIGKNRDLGPDRFAELSSMIMARADAEQQFFNELYQLIKTIKL